MQLCRAMSNHPLDCSSGLWLPVKTWCFCGLVKRKKGQLISIPGVAGGDIQIFFAAAKITFRLHPTSQIGGRRPRDDRDNAAPIVFLGSDSKWSLCVCFSVCLKALSSDGRCKLCTKGTKVNTCTVPTLLYASCIWWYVRLYVRPSVCVCVHPNEWVSKIWGFWIFILNVCHDIVLYLRNECFIRTSEVGTGRIGLLQVVAAVAGGTCRMPMSSLPEFAGLTWAEEVL